MTLPIGASLKVSARRGAGGLGAGVRLWSLAIWRLLVAGLPSEYRKSGQTLNVPKVQIGSHLPLLRCSSGLCLASVGTPLLWHVAVAAALSLDRRVGVKSVLDSVIEPSERAKFLHLKSSL